MDTDSLRTLLVKRLNDMRREHFDQNASRMADAVGISQSKMSRLLSGKQSSIDPYLEAASKLSSTLDIPLEKLTALSPRGESEDEKLVRMYDVVVGAGDGVRPIEEWSYVDMRVPRSIVRALIGHDSVPDQIGITQVRGQSMYPEVQSGDYVLWTPEDRVVDGGTYVIHMDDALLLKVLQRKPGRRLRIHSLNTQFSDDFIRQTKSGEWVTQEGDYLVDFHVVGRFLNVLQPKDLFRGSQRVHDLVQAYAAQKSVAK